MDDVKKLFVCTQCGFCCHGETTVSLDEDDRRNMVEALGLDEAEVAEKYWKVTGATVQMKTVDGHCIFFKNGCTIYEGRPWRCRQWPLVPALEEEGNFRIISDSCPGISRELSFEEFQKLFRALKKD